MTTKINDSFIDELVKNCKTADDVVGSNGIVKELTKRLLERILDAELTTHLGYDKYQFSKEKEENSRNGYSSKTVLTGEEEIKLKIPRIVGESLPRRLYLNTREDLKGLTVR